MTTRLSTDTMFAHGHALLIGVDQNARPRLALPVVARDVAALAAVLTDPQVCAYPPAQVETLTGPAVTRDGIFDALDRLRARIDADTSGDATAVVYYSGHGWRDERNGAPEHYLIPYDIDPDRPHRSALSAREFAREIANLAPRRLLVLLDCCHAHGMGAKELPQPAPLLPADTAFPIELLRDGAQAQAIPEGKSLSALQDGEGRAVLSSSRGDERSYYFRDQSVSIFTHHLIEALTGHGSTSAGQTQVLVSDILAHVAHQVPHTARAQCERPQHPDCHVNGNFPVAMLLGGKGLRPDEPPPDRQYVVQRAARRHQRSVRRNRIGDVHGQASIGDGNIQVGPVNAGGNVAIGRDITMATGQQGPYE